ncbi:MAG: hypothetical protein VBE63_22180 [Lamprobacter sp.]|uniref:hypothetical protein n=1 Tax=Lamprobacter sp. TaxID=3100796 RepID=UPI002B260862|nr:hypothetical protein [Lamprobacter sp.]MEA3642626.1 hypothetical protein [Lamprobacter sp.]
MTDLKPSYEALSDDERRILQVLSVVYEPINQTTLQQIVRTLGWKDAQGKSLAALVAGPLRQRLLKSGCLVATESGLVCARELAEPLTRETVRAGLFNEIVRAGEKVVSSQSAYHGQSTHPDRQARRLRNALYAGREDEVLSQLGLQNHKPGERIPDCSGGLLSQICTRSLDRAWLEGLSPRLRVLGLAPTLVEAGYWLTVQPDLESIAQEILTPLIPDFPEVSLALAERYLLDGRAAKAASILADRAGQHTLSLIGWLHFIQGRYGEALAVFDLLLTTERGEPRLDRDRIGSADGLGDQPLRRHGPARAARAEAVQARRLDAGAARGPVALGRIARGVRLSERPGPAHRRRHHPGLRAGLVRSLWPHLLQSRLRSRPACRRGTSQDLSSGRHGHPDRTPVRRPRPRGA